MASSHKPAAEVAKWQRPTWLWLDHARVGEDDLEWMAPAEWLVLWNVRLPDGFLARLPELRGVSVRGGSRDDLALLDGCDGLLAVDVNQVRRLTDLGQLARLRSLEFLSLYGLPKVEALPDLGALEALHQVQLGSMKGLRTLAGLGSIPRLTTLQLSRAVSLSDGDVDMLASHPTLEEFDWFAEDVPVRVFRPVVDRMSHLRRARPIRPEHWLAERLQAK